MNGDDDSDSDKVDVIKKNSVNKLVIITPFKVGSTTLTDILQKYYGYTYRWENSLSKKSQGIYDKYSKFILRGHTAIDHHMLVGKKFDIWFTLVRKPTDIFISSYFQDINNSTYPYFFGTKDTVLNTPVLKLLLHFLSFNWCNFNQCSQTFNFNEIKKYTGIDIWEQPFDVDKGYSIYSSPTRDIKVVVLTMEQLSNIQSILTEVGITSTNTIPTTKKNVGSEKWYSAKYKQVKRILPPGYYKRYAQCDARVIDKFYREKNVDIELES